MHFAGSGNERTSRDTEESQVVEGQEDAAVVVLERETPEAADATKRTDEEHKPPRAVHGGPAGELVQAVTARRTLRGNSPGVMTRDYDQTREPTRRQAA